MQKAKGVHGVQTGRLKKKGGGRVRGKLGVQSGYASTPHSGGASWRVGVPRRDPQSAPRAAAGDVMSCSAFAAPPAPAAGPQASAAGACCWLSLMAVALTRICPGEGPFLPRKPPRAIGTLWGAVVCPPERGMSSFAASLLHRCCRAGVRTARAGVQGWQRIPCSD